MTLTVNYAEPTCCSAYQVGNRAAHDKKFHLIKSVSCTECGTVWFPVTDSRNGLMWARNPTSIAPTAPKADVK
jgi:hypothetical protein